MHSKIIAALFNGRTRDAEKTDNFWSDSNTSGDIDEIGGKNANAGC
jgi:hypothetical protein